MSAQDNGPASPIQKLLQESQERANFCLYIDMVGSTEMTKDLESEPFYSFNLAFIVQIEKHLKELALTQPFVKFTGDGWIIVCQAKGAELAKLICLGLIEQELFSKEMLGLLSPEFEIPGLRIAIAGGLDIKVEIPFGGEDWAGDSIRKAQRACSLSDPIDGPKILVEANPLRDRRLTSVFETADFNAKPTALKKGKKWEVPYEFVEVKSILPKVYDGTNVSATYLYMKKLLGGPTAVGEVGDSGNRSTKANLELLSGVNPQRSDEFDSGARADQSSVEGQKKEQVKAELDRLSKLLPDPKYIKGNLELRNQYGYLPSLDEFNEYIKEAGDFDEAMVWYREMDVYQVVQDEKTFWYMAGKASELENCEKLLEEMKKKDFKPRLSIYQAMLRKAATFQAASFVMGQMAFALIAPSVSDHVEVIAKADRVEHAEKAFEEMERSGHHLDEIKFNGLIRRSRNIEVAKALFAKMESKGLKTDEYSLNGVLSHDLKDVAAKDILKWYWGPDPDRKRPSAPMNAAISSYRKLERPFEALEICRYYPHLTSATKVFQMFPRETEKFYKDLLARDEEEVLAGRKQKSIGLQYGWALALIAMGRAMETRPLLEWVVAHGRAEPGGTEHCKKLLKRWFP